MIEAGYPGKLLPFILDALEGSLTVLDIGAGTGFFSIPLAQAGHLVTAVEPSEGMFLIMEKNIPPAIHASIKICRAEWESWNGEFHDAAICVHSLYPMNNLQLAIRMIDNSAAKKILIVRENKLMRTLPGIIRERFGILSNRDLNSEIRAILNEISAEWKVFNICEQREYLIKDIGREVSSIIYQLRLNEDSRDEVCRIADEEINYRGGSCFFDAIYSDNAYIF